VFPISMAACLVLDGLDLAVEAFDRAIRHPMRMKCQDVAQVSGSISIQKKAAVHEPSNPAHAAIAPQPDRLSFLA